MATSRAVTMYRGDSHVVDVAVVSESATGVQTPLDLTDAIATLSVKSKPSATPYLLQVVGVVEDAVAGTMSFTLSPADTQNVAPGVYVYDVQVSLSGGRVYTVVRDKFELLEDVTRP